MFSFVGRIDKARHPTPRWKADETANTSLTAGPTASGLLSGRCFPVVTDVASGTAVPRGRPWGEAPVPQGPITPLCLCSGCRKTTSQWLFYWKRPLPVFRDVTGLRPRSPRGSVSQSTVVFCASVGRCGPLNKSFCLSKCKFREFYYKTTVETLRPSWTAKELILSLCSVSAWL